MSSVRRAGCGISKGAGVLLLVLFTGLSARSLAATYGDFNYTNAGSAVTITGYTGSGGAVSIPPSIPGIGTVTCIGINAFAYCTSLTNVTIPSGATNIGDGAFALCSGLTGATIPDSVTRIGTNAFVDCTRLTSITLPASVTSIGNDAFHNCSGLTNVRIPAGVTTIGDRAFAGCSALTGITVDDQNPQYSSVGGVLFNKDLTTLIQYPGGLGGGYTIPSSVTSLGDGAFAYCTGLTSVSIPGGVASIGYSVFGWCSGLTNVSIPNSVTNIGDGAFWFCSGLTNVTLPNSVTSIGFAAFYECSGLTSFTIPSSVISIGEQAFYGCSALVSFTIPSSVTSIGGLAFYGCSSLASFTIPSSITSISNHMFYHCSGLTSVTIPDSVISIGGDVFYSCSGLTSVTIPNGVTSIGGGAFSSCSGLTNVTIPNGVTNIGGSAFYGCSGLTGVAIPNSVTSIGNAAFCECSGLTGVTLPSGVTTIGDSVFYGCSDLTNVTIQSSVISIADYAFAHCTALTSVTLPNSVTNIGNSAFYMCSGLTSVSIPKSVTRIGDEAFYGCVGLANIKAFGSVTSLGFKVFSCCSCLTNLTIPNSVISLGRGAFSSCSSLTSVTIPSSVTSIGDEAFYDCWSLTSAYFQGNAPTSFGSYVFSSAEAGAGFSIYYPATAAGWTTPTWGGYPAKPYAPGGALQVSIAPADAVSAGAQWQVDGGTWQDSGTTLSDLLPGQHTISFKTVDGWTSPGNQRVSVSASSTASVAGTYVRQFGSLHVTLSPAFAVGAGAQWQVNGGAWQKSGVTLSGLPAGTQVVSFKTVNGLSTPSNQVVTIKNNQTTSFTGSYSNPFIVAAGTYEGLFSVPGDIAPGQAGRFTFSITTNATYSGHILLRGQKYTASGPISLAGGISTSIGVKTAPVAVNLQLNLTTGSTLTGTVAGRGWTADALAYRTGKAVGAGKYTLLIPGCDDSAACPGGEGCGSLTVKNIGTAILTGTLADGTVMTSAAGISTQGQWPFYASLYSGKGVILGWLTFSNKLDSDLDGPVNWVKQAQVGTYYAGGFTNQGEAVGSSYTLADGQVFPFSPGQIAFSEGNLSADFAVPLSVSRNLVTSTNRTLVVTINPATGFFSGSVANPSGGKPKTLSFKGAVLQKQNTACGYFLGINQSGRVEFKP